MTKLEERRHSKRIEEEQSGLGIAIWQIQESSKNITTIRQCSCFVGICNHSENGMMIESPELFAAGQSLVIMCYAGKNNDWQTYDGELIWSQQFDNETCKIGFQYTADKELRERLFLGKHLYQSRIVENLDFFITLPLLKYLPRKSFWALLNCLTPCDIPANKRVITQGDEANSLYIIEKGSGHVTIDTDDEEVVLTNLGPRDLVGEMALLTGEPRVANFTADTDMQLWRLEKADFEQAVSRFYELRTFLTELLTHRLETSSHSTDRTVGKYIAKRKLGTGAWAIVYQGVHQALKKTIAIKMLKHQMAMDPEFSAKFLKEAEIIASMNHPNIVHVYDIESLYATHFIIMEYLEGESMELLIKRSGALDLKQAVSYLLQVCSGLEYAHELKIVHQDIKPDNILIQEDGTVKILDFGLACPIGSENFEMEGTIQYMSPEQIESYPVDARTDIYCLGITAFEMVTGKQPYSDENLQQLMEQRLGQDIMDPAELRQDLPDRLCQFIKKACARAPEHRFQSANSAKAELEALAQEIGLHETAIPQQHMSSLFLFYTEEQRTALADLLEEFSERANSSGISLQLADFANVTNK